VARKRRPNLLILRIIGFEKSTTIFGPKRRDAPPPRINASPAGLTQR
jgi:hypothetical protein